jgi:NHLM bacteriocin system ABC transporter ATP-binding protein
MSEPDSRISAGNNVVHLGPADRPVVVRNGTVDVFSVRPNGVRFPIARVSTGEGVLPSSGGLLLVCERDATIDTLPAAADLGAVRSAFAARVNDTLGPLAAELPATEPDQFGDALGRVIDEAWQENSARREEVSAASLAYSTRALQDALRGIADSAITLDLREEISHPHPLVWAVQRVGEFHGFAVSSPTIENLSGARDPILLTAQQSGVRYREVTLTPDWQKGGVSAYLGFLRSSDSAGDSAPEPVALLPSPRGYRIQRRDHGAPRPLDPELADRLLPNVCEFYAPLPKDRAARARDVLGLGLQGSKLLWAVVLALGLAVAVISLATPILTNVVVGAIIPRQEYGPLIQVGAGLTVAALVAFVFAIVQGFAVSRITQKATRNMQSALWDRVLSLPAFFFRGYSSGDLTVRVLAVDSLQQLVSVQVVSAVLAGAFGLVNVVLMFRYGADLAIAGLAVLLVTVAVFALCTRAISRNAEVALETSKEGNSWLIQMLAGLPKIRVAHAEKRLEARHFDIARRQASAMSRQTLVIGRLNAWFGFIASGSTALFLLVVFLEWHGSPPISTANYLAFASAYGLAFAGVAGLTALVSPIANAGPTFRLLMPIMNHLPETTGNRQDPGRLEGRIELRDVTFRYTPGGPQVLKGLDLEIQPGEMIALTGSSGAGKSTITRLLLGFDVPEEGQVLFDGRDLNDLSLDLVRAQMGVVVQNGVITRGTVLRNIVGALPDAEPLAWRAAERAAIADEIRAMPMGMQTIVDPANISGGQAQRILLARALVHDPAVIILDEATSALDNASQKAVTDAMNALSATRVVIAHRLSTIRAADRIVVMEAGVAVEVGTFDELMAADGHFAALVRRQIA